MKTSALQPGHIFLRSRQDACAPHSSAAALEGVPQPADRLEVEGLSFSAADVPAAASPAQLVRRLLEKGIPSAAPLQIAASLVPWCPMALAGRVTDVTLDKYMKARTCELEVQRGEETTREPVGVFSGPGHNAALVGALALRPDGRPDVVLKRGDTRIARVMHGDVYVKNGFVAGRCDKIGVDGGGIALDEIAEEIGGETVPGGFWTLGATPSPSMPHESTEADLYKAAIIRLNGSVTGDGTGAEVTELMGALVVSPQEASELTNSGQVADASRVRVMYGRAFDSIGYIPELDAYAADHPGLQEHFDTLGLGPVHDVRALAAGGAAEPGPGARDASQTGAGSDSALAARINHGIFVERRDLPFGEGRSVVDAVTSHAFKDGESIVPVKKPFPQQLVSTTYDRAKVALYFIDAKLGPMVKMAPVERSVMAAKGCVMASECVGEGDNVNLVRLDVPEVKLSHRQDPTAQVERALRSAHIEATARLLASSTTASAGQSNLYYHFYAVEVQPRPDDESFVPLSDALAACRLGEGDAQTQDAVGLLARHVGWIPSLRMTVDAARARMEMAPARP